MSTVKRYNPFKSAGFYVTIVLAGSWYALVLSLILPTYYPLPPKHIPVIKSQESHFDTEGYRRMMADYERRDHERRMRQSMDSIDSSLQRIANQERFGRAIIQD